MALTLENPVISSNLKIGYGVFGTADAYNTALLNNGALNPLGALYFAPPSAMGGNTVLASVGGYASGTWLKYVLYKSTANPAMVAGPAAVYYTDETFTTVTGRYSEGNPAATGNVSSVAGFLLPNTSTTANIGVGTAISATILNNGGSGSYVWIALCGFVPQTYVTSSTTIGDQIMGKSGADFSVVTVTTVLRPVGYIMGTISGTYYADIVATIPPC